MLYHLLSPFSGPVSATALLLISSLHLAAADLRPAGYVEETECFCIDWGHIKKCYAYLDTARWGDEVCTDDFSKKLYASLDSMKITKMEADDKGVCEIEVDMLDATNFGPVVKCLKPEGVAEFECPTHIPPGRQNS